MKSLKVSVWAIVLFFAGTINIAAQSDNNSPVKQVKQDKQSVVDAIAMYPPDVRKEVFEASRYPEVITKLVSMQKKTQQDFDNLLAAFDQTEQERIWNLTRYPGLIADLCFDNKKSRESIRSIMEKYPEEIRKTGIEEGEKRPDLICNINDNSVKYDAALAEMLKSYPPEVDSIFRDLIAYPEILTILADNMQLTVLLGDEYKNDPKGVLHKSDSLSLALATKNAKETSDWKQEMDNNQQARQQYVDAAKEYALFNGYQIADYSAALIPGAINYYTYAYNWWFGYPYWYPYAYWDPYPYWYDWGFYYGPDGEIEFFGLPSAYFMDWFFYYPEHCYRYPELANIYYIYYTNHNNSWRNNSICRGVDEWRERNRDIVNSNWDNAADRAQLFREYGKMEESRIRYNKDNPDQKLESHEYLQKQQTKFPGLYSAVSKGPEVLRTPPKYARPSDWTPEKVPVFKAPDSYKANSANTGVEQRNVVKPQENVQQQSPGQQKANYGEQPGIRNTNQFRDAQQYHRNTWQDVRPQQNFQHSNVRQDFAVPHYQKRK